MIEKPQVGAFAYLCAYVEADAAGVDSNDDVAERSNRSFLAFVARGERYLVQTQWVAEISHDVKMITRFPFSPPWLLGFCTARGKVYSVLDFAYLMRSASMRKPTVASAYLMLSGEGEGLMLKVDEIIGIKNINLPEKADRSDRVAVDVDVDGGSWRLLSVERLTADGFLSEF